MAVKKLLGRERRKLLKPFTKTAGGRLAARAQATGQYVLSEEQFERLEACMKTPQAPTPAAKQAHQQLQELSKRYANAR